MITPRPPSALITSFSAIFSAHRRSTLKVPTRLTCSIRLKSASGKGPFLPIVRLALPMPAKLQLMWIAPKASIVAAIPAATESSSVTFTLQKMTLSPNSAARAAPFSSFISKMATLAPLAKKRFTPARPRPDAPPVITATLSFNSMGYLL